MKNLLQSTRLLSLAALMLAGSLTQAHALLGLGSSKTTCADIQKSCASKCTRFNTTPYLCNGNAVNLSSNYDPTNTTTYTCFDTCSTKIPYYTNALVSAVNKGDKYAKLYCEAADHAGVAAYGEQHFQDLIAACKTAGYITEQEDQEIVQDYDEDNDIQQ
jgi:hypothetical protein